MRTAESAIVFGIYSCPKCCETLLFTRRHDNADEGQLLCQNGHTFPIISGLPRFVTDEGYSANFGYEWQLHSRTQLDSITGKSLTRDRFFKGTGWPDDMHGELVLEAGCGSGRFTEILLSTGAKVVSFDYSLAAEVTFARFANKGVRVSQASIYGMPYRPASFDRVFCYGVLQHCPDVKAAFFCLVKMLKPGGFLAVDVYDRRKLWFHSRYRVRWLTTRIRHEKLYQWCKRLISIYMRVFPPMHPWNLLIFPIKDYRGQLPGLTREQEMEWSILDTFDFLSPRYDKPQSLKTMKHWCEEAGLVNIETNYGGNGIEVRARRPL